MGVRLSGYLQRYILGHFRPDRYYLLRLVALRALELVLLPDELLPDEDEDTPEDLWLDDGAE